MARSLGQATYRALPWRSVRQPDRAQLRRQAGQLLWVHVSTRRRFIAMAQLCRRLLAHRHDLQILFTVPTQRALEDWGSPNDTVEVLPADHLASVRLFLDHWKPDLCLWTGGGFAPTLTAQTAKRNVPIILSDVGDIDLPPPRHRWLPDLPRSTLDSFDTILVTSETAARRVRRSGIAFGKVSVTVDLQPSPNPPAWPEEELSETTNAVAGRPVWLAACVQDDEFISVLIAHRHALRFLHRMLLILHVADPAEARPLKTRLEAMDLRCADWDDGDLIEDTTQVVVSTEAENLGLWYRIAPLTFMASSLETGHGGRDPLTAAALGSAIVYGPNVRNHIESYARLEAAGAARRVTSAEALGADVVRLIAPDVAAEMALAGWTTVTQSAELTDHLIGLIQDRLDTTEVPDARP